MDYGTATRDTIGNWEGLEQEAVECWNRYVAPALRAYSARTVRENGEAGVDDGYVTQHAWELFCNTDDSESFEALGQRVASWIRAQAEGNG